MIWMLLACAPEPDSKAADTGPAPVDLRVNPDDLPALTADQMMWLGPETVIPAYTDTMVCVFGTYTGPDIGMHSFETWQGAGGHHMVLMGTTLGTDVFADGDVADCTSTGTVAMQDMDPLILNTAGNTNDLELPLPDGMAAKLRSGQRYVLQSHYLNTTDQALLVRDIGVSDTIPEDEVAIWTAPLVYNYADMEIPAQGALEVSFDCSFDDDFYYLYLQGHMHEWGTRISIDQVDQADQGGAGGEVLTNRYSIDPWMPEMRDLPPTNIYEEGSFLVPAGTVMRTTCAWQNDTDEAILFPHEMCDGVAMVYPSEVPRICDGVAR